jgi:serine protease AprX
MKSITWKKGATAGVLLAGMSVVSVNPAAADEVVLPERATDTAAATVNPALDSEWGTATTAAPGGRTGAPSSWSAAQDLGSLFSVTQAVGAQAAWADKVTGKGVTVALVDTGVAPVEGLHDYSKVIDGPDLSFDGQRPGTRYVDGFGHGTHLAGVIAGRDAGFDAANPSSDVFAGVAPDAGLLNVKVAAADGGADVSQVIAAIDWIVENRRAAGMNVRVINLSYGTASTQPWQIDPLARAVENAWDNGIVVVAAAGNDGLDAGSLIMPAVDPHILSVGAVDNRGTRTPSDDVVAGFTNGGTSARRPDILAPGTSVVSLRVPGSYVDAQHPEGNVAGDTSRRFFRGSGTSQAAAVVAGEAALLLQDRPWLTPDQVKALLKRTARPLSATSHPAQGAGVANVAAALAAKVPGQVAGSSLPSSTGTGSLEASRGGEHVIDPWTGIPLVGEVDVLGGAWNPPVWTAAQDKGDAWVRGWWNDRRWTGTKWVKGKLEAVTWTGDSWSGLSWSSYAWSEDQWLARSWRTDGWEARSWREASWTARSWRGQ